jgi:surface carbohydrate biosynthesis protein
VVSEALGTERRPRVCLVVDNPMRDLEGLVLLALQLARRGADPILVPMYEQGYEVLGLAPDAVVVNYARTTNRFLLEAYREARIAISVLDTEGGVVDSVVDYAFSLHRNGTVGLVDQVMTWGPLQAAAFREHSGLRPEQVVLTGCPRMDLCAQRWRSALPAPDGVEAPFVLVNTNFSLVNPRFARSREAELATSVQAGFSGWDLAYVRRLATETTIAYQRMKALVAELAGRLPGLRFVLRPHPFEALEPYQDALAGHPNVQIRLEGAVMPWIASAEAVLHLNCGSAVEAVLMGVPALSPEWLNADPLVENAPLPGELSQPVGSLDELVALLEPLGRGGALAADPRRLEEARGRVLEWFHNHDGRAAERAADAVLALISERHVATDHRAARRLALIGGKRHRRWVGLADGIGRVMAGRPYRAVRARWLTGGVAPGARRAKAFDVEDVRAIAARLVAVDPDGGTAPLVEKVGRLETGIPGIGGSAIRLRDNPGGAAAAWGMDNKGGA